ncbi:facilitated trehalose transporter Tret1-like [Leptopilina boulardi]|uniref:facilitated trehalose transporter Tret1-like n=1 Tax=Leptopilina boulardi TaxID=63433 RepID=UPI0021F5886E|nr:facilitated trehalose transporter Tret1-like [Leptopilina boulardi]
MTISGLCFKKIVGTKETENEKTKNEVVKLPFWKQFMSILSGYFLMAAVGTGTTWASPSLPYLTSKNSEFQLTITQGAWLVSIGSPIGIIGYILCGTMANSIGRKFTILTFGLITLLAMIFIQSANDYTTLLIGRMIMGIGNCGCYSILTLYIGEIAHESLRGRFLTFDKMSVNIGAFLMTTAGALLSYENMNLVMIFIPLLGIAIFPVTSETPYYYLLKEKNQEAIDTRMKLMETDDVEMVMRDIGRMKKGIDDGKESEESSIRELFIDPGCRRALILKLITSATYSFSGYLAIQAYAQDIFSHSNFEIPPQFAVMIMTGAQILAALPSSQIVDFWGRRPTFLLSGILSSLSLSCVGLYFYLKSFHDVSTVTWLPLIGLLSFTFSCNIGLTTIPYLYMGELFSVKVKSVASMITLIIEAIFSFTAKMIFPLVSHWFGIYVSFWIFALSSLFGAICVFCLAPETKGKNLEEVLELLRLKAQKNEKC